MQILLLIVRGEGFFPSSSNFDPKTVSLEVVAPYVSPPRSLISYPADSRGLSGRKEKSIGM